VETHAGAQLLRMECRDFGGSYTLNFLVQRLERLSEDWVETFKRQL
jgi:hypothetical protein